MSSISADAATAKPGFDDDKEEYVFVTVKNSGQVVAGPPPSGDSGDGGKSTSINQTLHFCAVHQLKLCAEYCNLGAYVPGSNDGSSRPAEMAKLLSEISLKLPK